MISFDEAKHLIKSEKLLITTEKIACHEALYRIVAEDIFAPIDLPPFDNSAVDGYAVDSNTFDNSLSWPICFSVQAGVQDEALTLPLAHVAKIMTGAPVPKGADAVIMKEDVHWQNGLVFAQKAVKAKDHIRFRGEDIGKYELAVPKGHKVCPRTMGLLHALGVSRVLALRPPCIAIISTGNELSIAPSELKYGQVYYLMGPMLRAQCHELGISTVTTTMVPDDLLSIIKAIEDARDADIVLLTGGMSKGDHDLGRLAFKQCGVEQIFFEGAWRPGKPLYFGKKNKTVFFGLPGNPNAAFVCFHVFVRPFIRQALGQEFDEDLPFASLSQDFLKKPEFTIFALAKHGHQQQLCPSSSQGSHQINSLCKASALAVLPQGKAIVKAGHIVHYYPLESRSIYGTVIARAKEDSYL